MKADEFYEDNIKLNNRIKDMLTKKINIISISRLIAVIIFCIFEYYDYKNDKYSDMIFNGIIFACVFIIMVWFHNKLANKRKIAELYIEINTKGIMRINGEFNKFDDDGSEFYDEEHAYINDSDIFGHNSLFQYINTTVTAGARKILAEKLMFKKKVSENDILKVQESIKELSDMPQLRQKIWVFGNIDKVSDIDFTKFISWIKDGKKYGVSKIITAVLFICAMVISIYLIYIKILPESFFMINIMANFCVLIILNGETKADLQRINSLKIELRIYKNFLSIIEDEKYKSDYMKSLLRNLKDENIKCTRELDTLCSLLDWLDNSMCNLYYKGFNIVLCLDVFLFRRLYKWKEKNKDNIKKWADTIDEIDALSSIANIAFENNTWVYPKIDNNIVLYAKNIGHPLINKKSVLNDFNLNGKHKTALITGSNMSGKSTFLRTVGINLILSYIGAPVYAEKFSCSIMNIYTCMRTKDNLEESISSFYAEILRIKKLIDAGKNGEKIFFLLDEIFKGTNSKDRHLGAKILIKQLMTYGGCGLVSTHDLELCDLEDIDEKIVNYNFREYYNNNKIKFDYKLRKGRSKTQNAVYLMKMAGIEIENI